MSSFPRCLWKQRRHIYWKELLGLCIVKNFKHKKYFGTWGQELTHWKRPWCWARFKAGGEGHDRGWGGWMASQTQWTWLWVNSRVGDGLEACRAAVHEVAKSWIWLSDWNDWFLFLLLHGHFISVSCNGPFSPLSRWEDSRFVSRLNLVTFSNLRPLSRWSHPAPWLFWSSLVW